MRKLSLLTSAVGIQEIYLRLTKNAHAIDVFFGGGPRSGKLTLNVVQKGESSRISCSEL
jgi:hypothetical protein